MTTAQDILNHKGTHVATIERSRTVVEAAEQMNALRIGCLVVTDHMRVVGIFTERDILVRVVAERRDPETTPVGSAMTSPIICCGPHTELDACREIVTEQRIRHIPVICTESWPASSPAVTSWRARRSIAKRRLNRSMSISAARQSELPPSR